MKQLPMLVKREFWEHRATFLYLPATMTVAIIAILLLIVLVLQTGIQMHVNIDGDWGRTDEFGRTEEHHFESDTVPLDAVLGSQLVGLSERSMSYRESVLDSVYFNLARVFLVVLWFIVFFYFVGCLYREREDRSVLFWKSLPVSDWLTVVSKLAAGLLLLPAIYLVFVVIIHLAFLLISTGMALNQPIDVWATLWAPANLFGRWLHITGYLLYSTMWCLPLAGWVLLVSSWARSAPLGWVVGIPIFVVILESIFTRSAVVTDFIRTHSIPALSRDKVFVSDSITELLVAVAIGVVFVMLAVWQRGKANEI